MAIGYRASGQARVRGRGYSATRTAISKGIATVAGPAAQSARKNCKPYRTGALRRSSGSGAKGEAKGGRMRFRCRTTARYAKYVVREVGIKQVSKIGRGVFNSNAKNTQRIASLAAKADYAKIRAKARLIRAVPVIGAAAARARYGVPAKEYRKVLLQIKKIRWTNQRPVGG